MHRAAAKNYFFTGVVVDPADYPNVASELTSSGGMLSLSTQRNLAVKGFARTAAYEAAIARYFAGPTAGDRPSEDPSRLNLSLPRAQLQAHVAKGNQKNAACQAQCIAAAQWLLEEYRISIRRAMSE